MRNNAKALERRNSEGPPRGGFSLVLAPGQPAAALALRPASVLRRSGRQQALDAGFRRNANLNFPMIAKTGGRLLPLNAGPAKGMIQQMEIEIFLPHPEEKGPAIDP